MRKNISATDEWGPWTQLSTAPGFSYNTGLADYPGYLPAYKKHVSGLVMFAGLVNVASAPPNGIIMTLPTALRPIGPPAGDPADWSYFVSYTSYNPYSSPCYVQAGGVVQMVNWTAAVGAYYGLSSWSCKWIADPTT